MRPYCLPSTSCGACWITGDSVLPPPSLLENVSAPYGTSALRAACWIQPGVSPNSSRSAPGSKPSANRPKPWAFRRKSVQFSTLSLLYPSFVRDPMIRLSMPTAQAKQL